MIATMNEYDKNALLICHMRLCVVLHCSCRPSCELRRRLFPHGVGDCSKMGIIIGNIVPIITKHMSSAKIALLFLSSIIAI